MESRPRLYNIKQRIADTTTAENDDISLLPIIDSGKLNSLNLSQYAYIPYFFSRALITQNPIEGSNPSNINNPSNQISIEPVLIANEHKRLEEKEEVHKIYPRNRKLDPLMPYCNNEGAESNNFSYEHDKIKSESEKRSRAIYKPGSRKYKIIQEHYRCIYNP